MAINKYTWKAFGVRQLKVYAQIMPFFLLMWNGIEIGDAIYGYFGWVSEGYGPPQQRWYRILASGFLFITVLSTFIDALSTWHYLKNPHEIPDNDADDESK